jgi:purine-binding chemotaxis protein CheW
MEEFAFHMDRVREILRVERPSEVPGTPKHVLGVLTVRGNILPVIDLRVMLGLSNLESEVVADATDVGARFKAWLTGAGDTVRSGAGKFDSSGAETSAQVDGRLQYLEPGLDGGSEQYAHGQRQIAAGIAHAQTLVAAEPAKAKEYFQQEVDASAQQVIQAARQIQEQREGKHPRGSAADRGADAWLVAGAAGGQGARGVKHAESARLIRRRKTCRKRKRRTQRHRQTRKRQAVNPAAGCQPPDQGPGASEAWVQPRTSPPRTRPKNTKSGTENASLGEQQFVTFRLGDGEYGVPIAKIQEIDRSSKMTRVPRTADYVDGITNLRGEVVPVINARKAL